MQTIAVEGIACPCPGTPHPDGDTVYLRAKLGLRDGVKLQALIVSARQGDAKEGEELPDMSPEQVADLTGALTEGYVRAGVVDWTFTDDDGRRVPVHSDTLQSLLLDDFATASAVADRADELYQSAVIGPLVKAAEKSSPDTTTDESTSPTPTGSESDQTGSRPSLTFTTPMDDTEMTSTSLAGAFS